MPGPAGGSACASIGAPATVDLERPQPGLDRTRPCGRIGTIESGADRSLGPVSDQLRLPRARTAVIPTDKLAAYALSPEHPRGRHKARVFASALGIGPSDWRYLHDQIIDRVIEAPVRATRITTFGVLYDVVVLIDGFNGATMPVATIWLVQSDRRPRLVSTWVDIP